MLEHAKEFACILAFDVTISKEVREFADSLGVRIFEDEIIYHLFDMFTAYIEEVFFLSIIIIFFLFFFFLFFFFLFFFLFFFFFFFFSISFLRE
jgi:hypothetical protein